MTTGKMYDYLFICAANAGRSQMAEAFYNHIHGQGKAISAAGIKDVRVKYNFRPHSGIVEVMLEVGIDISQQRIKMADSAIVTSADRVIVFCDPYRCPPFIRDLPTVEHIPVEDPYPGTEAEQMQRFRKIRDRLEEIVLEL